MLKQEFNLLIAPMFCTEVLPPHQLRFKDYVTVSNGATDIMCAKTTKWGLKKVHKIETLLKISGRSIRISLISKFFQAAESKIILYCSVIDFVYILLVTVLEDT